MQQPWNAPEYSIAYVGNPSSNASKLRTLKHAGNILTAKVHKLAVLMPDAYDDDSSGTKKVMFQQDMHELFFGGCLFDDEVSKAGTATVVHSRRPYNI